MKRRVLAVEAVVLALVGLAGCGDEQRAPGNVSTTAGGGSVAVAVAGAATGGGAQSGAAAGGGMHSGAGAGGASAGGVPNDLGGVGGGGGVAGASAGTGAGASAGGACAASPDTVAPWPGQNALKTLDQRALFESDLSGLTFEPSAAGGVLWAVNNLSGKLFRLLPSGGGFAPDPERGWAAGKALRYPSAQGLPDAEGVTFGADIADGVYVAAERDADDASTSRLSVLRYDVSGSAAALTATHEWNVTALLPKVGANAGLEAITWVPDSLLTGKGFFDETKAHLYAPSEYPDHGRGLFFVGVEETGKVHVLALDHQASSASLLATIATPNAGVMGLELDRDTGNLWFNCDDGCGNKSGIIDVDTRAGSATLGRFVVSRQFARPSTLPDSNNEGIAIGPASQCTAGFKPFYWTDDADDGGFSLRMDSIPCAACF